MSIRFLSSSATLFLAGLALIPTALAPTAMAAGTAEKPCETDLCRNVRQSWAAVRHGTSDAAHWTKTESVKGWDATKNGVSNAAHWTGREGEKGWKATKAGTKAAVHDIDPGHSDKTPDTKADSAGQ